MYLDPGTEERMDLGTDGWKDRGTQGPILRRNYFFSESYMGLISELFVFLEIFLIAQLKKN